MPGRDETFLLNTLTDARLLVSNDVVALLDRAAPSEGNEAGDRETLEELASHGFVVESREAERVAVDGYFRKAHEDTSMLEVTVLTTLQCNFACDYCIQGDHGDYNKHAKKMSLDTARRTCEWVEQRLDEVNPETFMLRFFGGEPPPARKGGRMYRRLIKTGDVDVAEQKYAVRYYEAQTIHGARRFSSEVILGPEHRLILDDDSVNGLESKIAYLVAASVYSRMLATRRAGVA